MAEENQAQQEPKEPQQVKQEPQRVTTKDPKKVEAGKRLATINRKKREAKKRKEAQNGGMKQYYGIGFSCAFGAGAVIAVGVIGGLGYYIYQIKKGGQGATAERGASASTNGEQPSNPQQNYPKPCPQTNKFEMD